MKLKKKPTAYQYLKLLNGVFNLTDKEIEILSKFLEHKQKYPDLDVFTAPIKKKVAEAVNMKDFNLLNVYIASFRKKKAVIGSEFNKLIDPNIKEIHITWNQEN